MPTSLLYVATLILTSCTMFFHFNEYRCSPKILLKAENTISTSHLLPYLTLFFHSSVVGNVPKMALVDFGDLYRSLFKSVF